MAEADEHGDEREGRPARALQPAERFVREPEVVGVGGGGSMPPCCSSVNADQSSRMTTMTVVIWMIRSASSLDSRIPCVLRHQK